MKILRVPFGLFRCATVAVALLALNVTVQATPITVDGTTYDIAVQNLKFGDSSAQDILTSTPWWGNETLALKLAAAVGTSLGVGSDWYDNGYGPLFTFTGLGGTDAFSAVWYGGSASTTAFSVGYLPAPFATGTVGTSTAGVPDGSTTLGLLSFSLAGLVAFRRKIVR